jgi:hypothetical protein
VETLELRLSVRSGRAETVRVKVNPGTSFRTGLVRKGDCTNKIALFERSDVANPL